MFWPAGFFKSKVQNTEGFYGGTSSNLCFLCMVETCWRARRTSLCGAFLLFSINPQYGHYSSTNVYFSLEKEALCKNKWALAEIN